MQCQLSNLDLVAKDDGPPILAPSPTPQANSGPGRGSITPARVTHLPGLGPNVGAGVGAGLEAANYQRQRGPIKIGAQRVEYTTLHFAADDIPACNQFGSSFWCGSRETALDCACAFARARKTNACSPKVLPAGRHQRSPVFDPFLFL